ncbi:acyl-CoA dehydrogenase family protein [Parafrankia sp. FMc6]|uniref:acyl-CoA dehydrogenase family protein n=1 Tax=Parafrankia soli TaxID=2599596 RepID=UPI0034D3D83A
MTSDISTGTGSAAGAANAEATESVADFRRRARTWIRANLRPLEHNEGAGVMRADTTDEEELAAVARERQIQRMLFDAGLAGICFPREYGGQGLSPEHQRAFNEEITGFEYPGRLQAPTFSPCAAVLLEFGTPEQKSRHLPAILKGEEIWMQFLSEPSSGSDVAGALTTAVREGDDWILNGSKIWTTGAWWSDWALCLARTNWDVPKHRGLTVFIMPLRQDGIDVQRIEMLNGNKEFCQEFITDVRVPDTDRIGDVDNGWTVGTRWMFHERMLHNSPFVTVPAGWSYGGVDATVLVDVARDAGRLDEPRVRDLIGEGRVLDLVRESLQGRIGRGVVSRRMPDQSAAIGRLFAGIASTRVTSMAYDIAGSAGAAWSAEDGAVAECGNDFLLRQTTCIGGGTTEMARNVISERVLGMPREPALDRDRAFRDVPRGGSGRS